MIGSAMEALVTWTIIALLAALVTIRTFLSFSIDVELDGCWPWARAKARAGSMDRTQVAGTS